RDAADVAARVDDGRSGIGRTVDVEDAEPSVDLAAVMLPRDRLLPGVAPLRERDRTLVETGFGGENAVVELAAVAWRPRLDPQPLELVLAERRLELLVEHLHRRTAVVAIRDAVALAPEHDRRDVLLRLDLALRSEAHAEELRAQHLAELGLRQEQHV